MDKYEKLQLEKIALKVVNRAANNNRQTTFAELGINQMQAQYVADYLKNHALLSQLLNVKLTNTEIVLLHRNCF